MNDIEAIVVAYHSGDVLPSCLTSLLENRRIEKVFVVDNSPSEQLGIEESPQVRVLTPGQNLGFGPGVNFARPHISTEYIAIVNPDTITTPETIDACVNYLDSRPHVALISPRVYVDGRIFPTSEHEISFSRLALEALGFRGKWGVQRPESDLLRTHATEVLNGAFLVARREALEDVDWFDESIFLFGEESDLCRRLRRKGYEVHYLSDGRVEHIDGLSSGRAPFDIDAYRRLARIEQLRRARGSIPALGYRVLLIAGRGLRHAVGRKRAKTSSEEL